MAAAVVMFGFVDSALIQPLPYSDLSRLMAVFETSPEGGPRCHYSYLNYLDLDRLNKVFSSTAAYNDDMNFVLAGAGTVHQVKGAGVTGSFFRILGVTPVLGRDFDPGPPEEDLRSAPATVILSYAAWQSRFGGRPNVLGESVKLNDEPYTVIGVLPRSFQFAPAGAAEFWTTLHPFATDSCALHRGCMVMGVIGRLKNGVTTRQALDDVQSIAAQEAKRYPDPDRNRGANIAPLSVAILGDIRPILLLLLSGAGLLLLIAYVNVTCLVLVRSENRGREFALRRALGAPRGRLMQQFIAEGFGLVALSSGLAVLLAAFASKWVLKLIPPDMLDGMPYLQTTPWNWHLTVFATALVLAASILLVLTPTLRLPFADLHTGFAEGDRATGTVWRHLGAKLVVLELATTVVLLAGAGLLGKSLYRLLQVDLGFVASHLATVHVLAPDSKYTQDNQAIALQTAIVSRLRSMPGVTAAGSADGLPLGGKSLTQIGFPARPSLGENNEVGHRTVSEEYFSVLKAHLLQGRYFNRSDGPRAPAVAIINGGLARRYFGAENPIGKQFFWHGRPQKPIQIVGVIADIKEDALDEKATPFLYTAFGQSPSSGFYIVARTSQDAAALLAALTRTVEKLDPGTVVSEAATMPELIQGSTSAYLHRAAAWLAGSFAGLALVLSTVGLYGTVAYSVHRRTREIGVRMALGATPGVVYKLILKEAGALTLIGVLIALPGSIAAGVLMRSLLFGVQSWDAGILAAVAAVLITSALAASYVPARRAALVNPVQALRAE